MSFLRFAWGVPHFRLALAAAAVLALATVLLGLSALVTQDTAAVFLAGFSAGALAICAMLVVQLWQEWERRGK